MMKGQLAGLMKQAQEMQAKMAKIQEELAQKEIEASSGGGMVTVRMNGQQEVLAVQGGSSLAQGLDQGVCRLFGHVLLLSLVSATVSLDCMVS